MSIRISSFFDNNKRNIFILALIALIIGIYHILTTAVVAKDGVTFINFAKRLAVEPKAVIVEQDQHPGFPAIILTTQKLVSPNFSNTENVNWAYSGQISALFFRILTVVVFYLLAVLLLKDKTKAFIATIIMIFLPEPAQYGSDCLSDWPHLFFLLAGYLLIIYGAERKNPILFGIAGLTAGLGYLIRPECVQVIVIGIIWLALQFVSRKRTISIPRIITASLLMVLGFCVLAVPYMNLKGALFPKKHVGEFTENIQTKELDFNKSQIIIQASIIPEKIAETASKFIENISRTYMYYFLPAVMVGLLVWFRKDSTETNPKIIIITALSLNTAILFWLHYSHGYMSTRHSMPMLILAVIFAPIGIEKIVGWLNKKPSSDAEISKGILILTIIGLAICSIRTFRPLHRSKEPFLEAAKWLRENTPENAVIDCFDPRIAFYAERELSKNSQYRVLKEKKGSYITASPLKIVLCEDDGYQIVITGDQN